MCEPTTLFAISLGVSAASAGAGYIAQSQQAKHEQRMADHTAEQARMNYFRQLNQSALREQQERESTIQQGEEVARQGAEARARARVSAAETGSAGLSVDALIGDFFRQEANLLSTQGTQFDYTRRQLQEERHGLRSATNQRIASAQPRTSQPSPFASALDFGGSALNAHDRYLRTPRIGER